MARIDAKHVTPARVLVEPEEALAVQAGRIAVRGVVGVIRACAMAGEVVGSEPEGNREDLRVHRGLKGCAGMAGR